MTHPWVGEDSRMIGGSLRRRGSVQERAGRTARLKAVPSAAWLGVGAADFLASAPCHVAGGVPLNAGNWRRASRSLALRRLEETLYAARS
jgi:hypothetical protein